MSTILCLVATVLSCSVVLVGKNASSTGRVLVGHNEDDSGELFVFNGIVPASDPAPGALMPAEPTCAKIPQAGHTCSFFWTEVKGREGGLSNADAFFNENGVFVVSDNAATEPFEDRWTALTDGGVYYNLRRAIAERAGSAREAVDIATNLITRWGYAASRGRIYSVADKDEAWTVEVLKGRRFVARRCPDDAVVVVPNCLTIGRLEPGDVVAPCVADEAAGDPGFDYARRFQGASRWRQPTDTLRWRHLFRIAAGVDTRDEYPYSVRPSRKVTPADLKAALSTHYENTPDEMRPCRHGETRERRYLPVCRAQTIESCICEFGSSAPETSLHVASGSPCEHPYRTFRPFGGGLPPEMDRSADAASRLERHFRPMSTEEYLAVQERFSLRDGVGRFRLADVSATVFYDAPQPLENGSACEVAVVLVHGWGGGIHRAEEQGPMMRALARATRPGVAAPYVVAPLFPRAGLAAERRFDVPGLAVWNASWNGDETRPCLAADDWRGGGDAIGTTLSSYDVVDRIFAVLADGRRYPNLKRVVLTGFSAGGQFADRYAAVGKGVVRDGVTLVYASMAPSTNLRFDSGVPWLYGLKDRPRYSAGLTERQILDNLTSRRVWRACGTQDVKGVPFTSLDITPPAMLQGKNRYERFLNHRRHLEENHPQWAAQSVFHEISGIAHDTVFAHTEKAFIDYVLGEE